MYKYECSHLWAYEGLNHKLNYSIFELYLSFNRQSITDMAKQATREYKTFFCQKCLTKKYFNPYDDSEVDLEEFKPDGKWKESLTTQIQNPKLEPDASNVVTEPLS